MLGRPLPTTPRPESAPLLCPDEILPVVAGDVPGAAGANLAHAPAGTVQAAQRFVNGSREGLHFCRLPIPM